MALPKLEVPTFELELPSSGKKVKYRPFLVKEHKILLMLEGADNSEVNRMVQELVDTCTFGALDVKSLPSVDIEYLFLNIRAKSLGEVYELIVNCPCGTKIDAQSNIDAIKVVKVPEHSTKISLTNSVGVEMTYPKFFNTLEIYDDQSTDAIIKLVKECIKGVYTPEQYTQIDESNQPELDEFLDGLTKDQFDKLEAFFVTMPRLVQTVEADCPECGRHNEVEIRGLENFFV
jgi:hypothetical protein